MGQACLHWLLYRAGRFLDIWMALMSYRVEVVVLLFLWIVNTFFCIDKPTFTLPQLARISSLLERLSVSPSLSKFIGATDVLALLTEGTETSITLAFLPTMARYVLCYSIRSKALPKLIAVVIASFLGQTMAATLVFLENLRIFGVAHVVCYVLVNVGCWLRTPYLACVRS
jgi:hypothetical protein